MNFLQVSLAILAGLITAAYGVKCDGGRRVEESDGLGKSYSNVASLAGSGTCLPNVLAP
jgi:hypothetical protein